MQQRQHFVASCDRRLPRNLINNQQTSRISCSTLNSTINYRRAGNYNSNRARFIFNARQQHAIRIAPTPIDWRTHYKPV